MRCAPDWRDRAHVIAHGVCAHNANTRGTKGAPQEREVTIAALAPEELVPHQDHFGVVTFVQIHFPVADSSDSSHFIASSVERNTLTTRVLRESSAR